MSDRPVPETREREERLREALEKIANGPSHIVRPERGWAFDCSYVARRVLDQAASSPSPPDREQAVEKLAVRYFNRSRWSALSADIDSRVLFDRAAPDLRDRYRQQVEDDWVLLFGPPPRGET